MSPVTKTNFIYRLQRAGILPCEHRKNLRNVSKLSEQDNKQCSKWIL